MLYNSSAEHQPHHTEEYCHGVHGLTAAGVAYATEDKAYHRKRDIKPVEPAQQGDKSHQHNEERNDTEQEAKYSHKIGNGYEVTAYVKCRAAAGESREKATLRSVITAL